MSENQSGQGAWLKVFCPNARCLSEGEVAELPPEKLNAVQESGREGLWLELFCPEGTCASGPQKFWTVEQATGKGGEKGLWLKLFCPEGSCQLTEPTDEA